MNTINLLQSRPIGFSLINELENIDRFIDRNYKASKHSIMNNASVTEFDNQFEISLDVAGIAETDIDIEAKKGLLTISAERKKEENKPEGKIHYSEQRYGSFSRSFKLPETIGIDNIEASYDTGVLTVNLPKLQIDPPRKICILPTSNQ